MPWVGRTPALLRDCNVTCDSGDMAGGAGVGGGLPGGAAGAAGVAGAKMDVNPDTMDPAMCWMPLTPLAPLPVRLRVVVAAGGGGGGGGGASSSSPRDPCSSCCRLRAFCARCKKDRSE